MAQNVIVEKEKLGAYFVISGDIFEHLTLNRKNTILFYECSLRISVEKSFHFFYYMDKKSGSKVKCAFDNKNIKKDLVKVDDMKTVGILRRL